MITVFTIGYEGTDIELFIDELERARIAVVADVRALPLSRKAGFSKSALRNALDARGIAYRHYPHLGDPKAGRLAARAGRLHEFTRIYSDHLQTVFAQEALEDLARIARVGATCMMCFERDPRHCHRSIIVNALTDHGLTAAHLFPEKAVRDDRLSTSLSRGRPREGAAATQ